jgi:PAS domain S-box-containing protein
MILTQISHRSLYSHRSKLLISIILGIASLLLSPYGIVADVGEITINIPWSLIFPIIITFSFGCFYGVVSGLFGGALFPFLLWATNGAPNASTALVYLGVYFILGYSVSNVFWINQKSKTLKISLAVALSILIFTLYYNLLFNPILSLNPVFWQKLTINTLPTSILLSFTFKDSVNLILLTFSALTILRINVVRRVLGLQIYPATNANGTIILLSILTAFSIWLLFVGLGNALLNESNALQKDHISLALLVTLSAGIIVARTLFYFSENQYHITKERNESENKFRNSIDFSPIPIIVAKSNGTNYFINKKFTETYGYKIEDIPNIDKWFELAYPDPEYNSFVISEWARIAEDSIVSKTATPPIEFNVTCKNGEVKIVEISMHHDKDIYIGLFTDVTQRKKSELELISAKEKAEQNERYNQLLFEILPIGLALTKQNGNFIYVNKAFTQIVGYSAEEVLNLSYWELTPSNYNEQEKEQLDNLNNSGFYGPYEKEYFNKMGALVPVRLYGRFIEIDGEKFIWSSVENISERKQSERLLVEAKEKAEESDRLKTAFLQNMSHEIRTPLNSICGFSERLNLPEIDDDKRKKYTEIILSSSNQLLSIVNDILTISSLDTKQERLNIEVVNVNSILSEQLAIFHQQTSSKGVALKLSKPLPDKNTFIYADKAKLTQVITNLLSNAIKFTDNGEILFGYNLKNSDLEFFVKDTGIGIEESKYLSIFNRFVQADKSIQQNFGGTGLGLSICKGFIELMKGNIWVESTLGKGSSFYFTIPYQRVSNNQDSSKTEDIQIERTTDITILIAEDQEFNSLYLEEILKESGCKLIFAKNGLEAVDLFKANDNINIVLLDIKMPIMDGLTAASIIKGLKPSIPIIAQTAYATKQEIEKFGTMFNDYLTKPITTEILTSTINKYLNSSNIKNV